MAEPLDLDDLEELPEDAFADSTSARGLRGLSTEMGESDAQTPPDAAVNAAPPTFDQTPAPNTSAPSASEREQLTSLVGLGFGTQTLAGNLFGLQLGQSSTAVSGFPTDAQMPRASTTSPTNGDALLSGLGLRFELNQGQFDSATAFGVHGDSYSLMLGPAQARFGFSTDTGETANLSFTLVGANAAATASGQGQLEGATNYLIGNDQRDWVIGVTSYAGVRFDEVWSGIDVHYYDAGGALEHDFIVAPGADASQIVTRIAGAEQVHIADNGDLVMQLSTGEMRQHAPIAYQEVDGARTAVASRFVLGDGGEVRFEVGAYDHERELVIDPVWGYVSYFGDLSTQQAFGVAVDSAGAAYVIGMTVGLWDPAADTKTTLPNELVGKKEDIFIAKFKPNGTALAYRTFVVGNQNDHGLAITVDADGIAFITGKTNSTNFPLRGAIKWQDKLNAPQNGGDKNLSDAFVAKLKADGSDFLWSTYAGGTGEDVGNAIAINGDASYVYVAGATDTSKFRPQPNDVTPLRPGGVGKGGEAFIARFKGSDGDNAYLVTIGGDGTDVATGIAVDQNDRAYITGHTTSKTNTFHTTVNAFQPDNQGK